MTVLFICSQANKNKQRLTAILESKKLNVLSGLDFKSDADIFSQADAVIAEITKPSINTGYIISEALSKQKRVLLLHTHGKVPELPGDNSYLVYKKYDFKSLPLIIDNFLKKAFFIKPNRYNFYISSSMADFLEKRSRERNLSKSLYLRQLIEKEMN